MVSVLKSFLKIVLYIGFLIALSVYAPKIMAKVLDTPYPLAAVTSGSMWPKLQTGDLILMRGFKGESAKVGDIVIYTNPRGYTIHRVVRIEEGKLVTKGDANNVADPPIDPTSIVGRPVYIGEKPVRIPKLGLLAELLKNK